MTGTSRRTTLGGEEGVSLVEHVLAALASMRIDNCIVELNAPEPPGLDGSCQGFVDALTDAGTRTLPAPRHAYTPERAVTVTAGNASLTLHPAENTELTITYMLDYGATSPIPRQIHPWSPSGSPAWSTAPPAAPKSVAVNRKRRTVRWIPRASSHPTGGRPRQRSRLIPAPEPTGIRPHVSS